MIIRRAFYYWQFIAAFVLPLWLVIGWPIFGAGGWQVLGVVFGALLLGLGLLVIALLFFARKEVREERAVSWADVGVLSLWHASIIAVGFYASSAAWLSVVVVVIGICAFWFALWELFTAARRRMQAMMDLLEQTAQPGAAFPPTGFTAPGFPEPGLGNTPNHTPTPDPNVIIVREKPASH
ncbi:hypothetical protein AB4Y63_07585 [Leifsonia sp. YAF41]|uniref:hypothetical protein n=1 Tax=Leifsonia sp. YAF41 TaxID=3233086 RepID=UPI003F99E68D